MSVLSAQEHPEAFTKIAENGYIPFRSPDGKKLAFGSERQIENSSSTHIWIIDLEKQLGEDFLSSR